MKGQYSSYKDFPLIALPDPDQVPRRGAAARRHPARPRVRDEGLVLLRPRRRGLRASYEAHRDAYVRIFDRLGFDYVIVFAVSGAMGGSASEEFLAAAENGEDTFVHCTNCDYAANTEAVEIAASRPLDPVDDAAGRARPGHPGHADDRLAGRPAQRDAFPRDDRDVDRGGHAEERRRQAACTRTAPASCSRSGVPGDREVDLKRLGGQLDPAEVDAFDETTSPSTRPWSRATSARSAGPSARGIRYLRRPARGRAARRGSPAPTSPADTSSTWSPAATSPPTARSRPPRSATVTRCPRCGVRWRSRAASRSATSSSSAASTPRRSASTCSTRTASRHGHDGLLRRRRVPGGGGDRRGILRRARASSGRARSRRPTSTWSRTGKDEAIFTAAECWPPTSRPPA